MKKTDTKPLGDISIDVNLFTGTIGLPEFGSLTAANLVSKAIKAIEEANQVPEDKSTLSNVHSADVLLSLLEHVDNVFGK